MVDYAKVISDSGLGDDMAPEDIKKLVEIAEPVEYSKGEALIKENDTTCDVFIIYKGWVAVETEHNSYYNPSRSMRLLKGRGMIGEFAFINKNLRSATVKAQENVSCIMFPFAKLEALAMSNGRLGYLLMRNMARRLAARITNLNLELRSQLIW